MSELIRKEMAEVKENYIYKELSIGLSNFSWYREGKPMVVYFELSPADGVQLVVTDEKPKGLAEVIFKKWLTVNDLINLKKCIQESIDFYSEIK